MTFRLWRFRVAVAGGFGYHPEVWKMWAAWARAEGGSARFNPWNTTEPWPGDTPYNYSEPGRKPLVRNYPNARAGTQATVRTLRNGFYPGLVRDFTQPGTLTAREIVARNAGELARWGTGSAPILALLAEKRT